MTDNNHLMATALVGTDRRRPPGSPTDPQQAVLAQAAVIAVRRTAGWLPTSVNHIPEAAPVDDRPLCSPRAAQVLDLVLQDPVLLPVLADWLRAAARTGRRPPRRMAPALLDLATRRRELRDLVVAATGPLGRWLALRNPAWQRLTDTVADVDIEEAQRRFATGTRAQREQALTELRRLNPNRGREELMTTWAGESAPDRAGLLARLAVALSDADEPFLETVLDDRAKSVRAAAVALLERLPTSRRASRMAARLQPLITLERKLEVAYPDEPDGAARRDGITDNAPSRVGTRAWWLMQMVVGAPLSVWETKTGMSPEDLLQKDSPDEVELAWAWAAERQRNAQWARLLFARRHVPGLLAVLPPAEAATLAEPLIASAKTKPPALQSLLEAVEGPWPASLSRVAIARYQQADPFSVQTAADLLGTRLDPAAGPLVEHWAKSITDNRIRRQVRSIHHALTLRQTIAEEFA